MLVFWLLWTPVLIPLTMTLVNHWRSMRDCDRCVKTLYTNSEELWKKLGEPRGFFWQAPGSTSLIRSGFSRNQFMIKLSSKYFDATAEQVGILDDVNNYRRNTRRQLFWGLALVAHVLYNAVLTELIFRIM